MEGFIFIIIVVFIVGLIVSISFIRDLKEEVRFMSRQLSGFHKHMEKITATLQSLEMKQEQESKPSQPVSEPEVIPDVITPITIPEPEEDRPERITEIPQESLLPPPPPVSAPATPPVPPVPPAVPVVPVITEMYEKEEEPQEELVKETEIHEEIVEPTTYFAEPTLVVEEKIVSPVEDVKPPVTPVVKEQTFLSQLWGENLLSKIGIITFVLGIAFFVKYAIDKDWINEVGRVGIGLLVGSVIIGIAHKLRKQYDVFSAILAGGGFAVFYITITLAFREYELIPQSIAFLLLVIVTIACVLFSLLYDKKELAIFSLLGGFAAPFLVSTGTGNYVVLFSYILLLNTGMMLIAFRKSWVSVNICVFVLSQIVIWTWLLGNFDGQYMGVFLFLLLFFIQFHTMGLTDHLKKGGKVTAFQTMIILWNNILFFGGALYIFNSYRTDLKGILSISLAVLNAIALLIVFKNKKSDKNLLYLLIATVLSLVTLAIPLQLEGNAITLFWAAEIVILLVLWQQSRISIFKYGVCIVTALVFSSYLLDLFQGYSYKVNILPVIINRYFITGATVVVALLVSRGLLLRNMKKEGFEETGELDFSTNLLHIFTVALYVVSFIACFCELNYQIKYRVDYPGEPEFRTVALLTYILAFATLIIFLKRKQVEVFAQTPLLLLGIIIGYNLIYAFPLANLRNSAYFSEYIPVSFFYIHLVSLPLIGYIIYKMVKYTMRNTADIRTFHLWVLTIATVVIFTWETDNLAIMLVGNPENYYSVLHAVHTFGYPILWGLLAMGLMIWGLKSREIILRKISLLFFALIIGKFYLYDVWRMSQAGRIVSFVALGIILLVVSFLLQRIKNLVKEDNNNENETSI